MIINKDTDKYLFNEYELFKSYDKADIRQRKAFAKQYVDGCKERTVRAYDLQYQLFDNLYQKFNVEFVSSSFADAAWEERRTLINSVDKQGIYAALGQCSGYLVFGQWCFSYSVLESGVFFTVQYRKDVEGERILFGNANKGVADYLNEICDYDEKNAALILGIAILIVKKYGEVETVMAASKTRRTIQEAENGVIMNCTPFMVRFIDSSWLRTIVRTEGFMVSGHFRLQPYGIGRCERKLIYIQPFEKHGYVRRAKKLVYEEQNNNIGGSTILTTDAA